jgi:SAM-dependent methyltransferase
MTQLPQRVGTEPCDGWSGWLDRWDRQQERYVHFREDIFALAFECIERLGAAPGRFLDLACGPGALTARVLRRFPAAEVTGVDMDPLLLAIARGALGDRATWMEEDLRQNWHSSISAPFDAVGTATALHWLEDTEVEMLVAQLADLVRPGGVFFNYDTLPLAPAESRLARLATDIRDQWHPRSETAGEEYDAWWKAALSEPAFAHVVARREERFAGRAPTRRKIGVAELIDVLRSAGFAEARSIAQIGSRHLVVAIR